MRILAAILLILTMGWYHAEANEKGNKSVLGSLAILDKGTENRSPRDSGEGNRFGGNLLGSFRRTAARLQEYDGLTPNGNFERDGLDWTRRPIGRQTGPKERGAKVEARAKEIWEWSQKKIVVPDSVKNYMIFFTMEGCGGCKQMYPHIKDLQSQGYKIFVIYNNANQKLIREHAVTSYPTMVIYDEGQQVKRYRGPVATEAITRYLNKPETPDDPDRIHYDFVDGPNKYKLW